MFDTAEQEFTYSQKLAIIQFLESCQETGVTLEDLISALYDQLEVSA